MRAEEIPVQCDGNGSDGSRCDRLLLGAVGIAGRGRRNCTWPRSRPALQRL